jgi:hypothetical protein
VIPFYPDIELNNQDLKTLNHWVVDNKDSVVFKDANMGGNRLTTRYTDNKKFTFPEQAYCIRQKLSKVLDFQIEIVPNFKDGMVASYALPGDTCYAHRDPRYVPELWTVHCNVILTAPQKGGELVVDGTHYEMPVGKFICYPVSEVTHKTLKIFGLTPRIMWVFGFCVSSTVYEKTMRKYL